jgi:hypothetical protein
MNKLYIILTVLTLILIFNYSQGCNCKCWPFCGSNCKCGSNNLEPFVDDYYSFNWNSPTLIDDVNTEKVLISGKGCSCFNKSENSSKSCRCTYSMSCDYSDDTAHSNCFAGYDRPGLGDLDISPSSVKFDRNQSI